MKYPTGDVITGYMISTLRNKSYPLLNVGGAPRYEIQFSEKYVKAIVKRYKPKFNKFISEKNN